MLINRVKLTPSASRLTNSLRDIGYDFPSAVADLVDNSISANATNIEIVIQFSGTASTVFIVDDGDGMTDRQLDEALRFGTRRTYASQDLGRYGLGLKTASISQCRRLTVVSRHAPSRRRLNTRVLDLDHVETSDAWEVLDTASPLVAGFSAASLASGPGTVVAWEQLDRVLPERNPEGGWAKRRLAAIADRTAEYLAMVFHRRLEDSAGDTRLTITVNGEKVTPWDPFATNEGGTLRLPARSFELNIGQSQGTVRFTPYVLPARNRFSSHEAFEYFSGPQKWNRQQGLYVYRAGRLITSGGWAGLRAIDEHTKLARASLEFDTDLDDLFQTNVAKMRINLPHAIRAQLEGPVKELCQAAQEVYRRASLAEQPSSESSGDTDTRPDKAVGATLIAAALATGQYEALEKIMEEVRSIDGATASQLGW